MQKCLIAPLINNVVAYDARDWRVAFNMVNLAARCTSRLVAFARCSLLGLVAGPYA